MTLQRTLKKVTEVTGVGLHSGDPVFMKICPAPENTGFVFRRIDLNPIIEIPASYEHVCDTLLCTSLQYKGVKVATVEHLLSSLTGLGIDNAYIDLDGPEVPILDGSAAPFVFLMQSSGIREQKIPKRYIRILKPIRVETNDKFVQFKPFNGYRISFTISFDHPVFNEKPQQACFDFSTISYIKEVCRARTFGFLSDYEKLREADLAKGGSLDNAVVVDSYRVLNEGGLRFEDEFVKHKVLDAIGDLSLLGSNLLGAFEGHKSGHELNNRLLRALMAEQDAWEYVHFDSESEKKLEKKLIYRPVLLGL
jgi:UDP-3-O-[3-hydroxymyristoyl] N-acetylglucosamine deacetylase